MGCEGKSASFWSQLIGKMELLFVNVEDCRKAGLGGRSGVWFGSRRSLSRHVDIRALKGNKHIDDN